MGSNITILALDLATSTGWAAGKPCGSPTYGTFKIKKGRPGQRFRQMAQEVIALIQQFQPTHVAYEEQFVGGKLTGPGLQTLFGFRAAAMMACENQGISPESFTPSQIRSHFLHSSKLKRTEAKQETIAQCRAIGWTPANDDEADALALWDFRAFELDRNHCNVGLFRNLPT